MHSRVRLAAPLWDFLASSYVAFTGMFFPILCRVFPEDLLQTYLIIDCKSYLNASLNNNDLI